MSRLRMLPQTKTGRLLAVLFFAVGCAFAGELHVMAPRSSKVIMVDGRLSPGEWSDASRVDVPHVATLYFKQAAGFVFIAVEFTEQPSGIVDLYLSPADGEIYDLHASAKLGERRFNDRHWPDWTWWNNQDWVANVSRADSWEQRTFLPERVREYQILHSRFPGKTWKLRFALVPMTANASALTTISFPANTRDDDTSGWLILELN